MKNTTWRGTPTALTTHAEALNEVMQFETVYQVHPNGTITERHDLRAPDLNQYKGDDECWHEHLDDTSWDLLTGWTGQYGYRGPMMHSSEFVGGRLAEHILSTPGLYALLVPSVLDPDDPDAQPDSWAIAYKCDDTGDHTLACLAHAVGCAVENLDADVRRVVPEQAVTTGRGYLVDLTATCYCDADADALHRVSRWITLGVIALDKAGAITGAVAS